MLPQPWQLPGGHFAGPFTAPPAAQSWGQAGPSYYQAPQLPYGKPLSLDSITWFVLLQLTCDLIHQHSLHYCFCKILSLISVTSPY